MDLLRMAYGLYYGWCSMQNCCSPVSSIDWFQPSSHCHIDLNILQPTIPVIKSLPRVPFLPSGLQNTMDPVTACNNFIPWWYFKIILLEVLLSSSNTTEYAPQTNSCSNKKHFFTVPSNPRVFHTIMHSTGNPPTMGMVKVMYTGKQNLCYPPPSAAMVHAFLSRTTWFFLDQWIFTICYRSITNLGGPPTREDGDLGKILSPFISETNVDWKRMF